jgi:hypothetical protein
VVIFFWLEVVKIRLQGFQIMFAPFICIRINIGLTRFNYEGL